MKHMLARATALMKKSNVACLAVLDSVLQLSQHKIQTYHRKAHVRALHVKANYYIEVQHYDLAKPILLQEAEEAGRYKFSDIVAAAKLNLGLVARSEAKYEDAVRYYMDALDYSEKVNDTSTVALAYYNLGHIYMLIKRADKSIEMLTRASEIFRLTQNKLGIANSISTLSVAYGLLGNDAKVLEMKLAAYEQFKELGVKKNMASITSGIGRYYEEHNEPEKALHYYDTSLLYYRSAGVTHYFGSLYSNLGEVYIKLKDTARAMNCADSAIFYSRKDKDPKGYLLGLNLKERVLSMQGNYPEAYATLRDFVLQKDSVYEKDMQRSIAEMDARYESGKKEAQISILKKDNTIQSLKLNNQSLEIATNNFLITEQMLQLTNDSLEIRSKNESILRHQQQAALRAQEVQRLSQESRIRQLELDKNRLEVKRKNLMISLFALLLLAALVSGMSLYRRVLRRRAELRKEAAATLQLAHMQAAHELQHEKLRIGKELHDNVGSHLTFINTYLEQLSEVYTGDTNITEARQVTLNTLRELRNAIWLIGQQEISLDAFVVKVREYLNALPKGSVQAQLDFQGAGQVVMRPETATHLFRIIQEGVNNALKYSGAKVVHISIGLKDNLQLTIADAGRGFDPAGVKRGNGFNNMEERAAAINASFSLESGQGKGTRIRVVLPFAGLEA
jgi:signal transduction histidine kinase